MSQPIAHRDHDAIAAAYEGLVYSLAMLRGLLSIEGVPGEVIELVHKVTPKVADGKQALDGLPLHQSA